MPARIRRILNVESGLNDGIATPFVTFFIAGTVADTVAHSSTTPGSALADLGIGVLVGVAVGLGGALLLKVATSRGWSSATYRGIGVLALALMAWALSIELSGNGFIAAFVAGLAFGTSIQDPDQQESTLEFDAHSGELLSLIVWFIFGAVLVTALDAATWQTAVFAILALTVVRMVPVAIALVGTRFSRRDDRLHRLVRSAWAGLGRVRRVRLRLARGPGGQDGARGDHVDGARERGRARVLRGAAVAPLRRICRRPGRRHTGARGGAPARSPAPLEATACRTCRQSPSSRSERFIG